MQSDNLADLSLEIWLSRQPDDRSERVRALLPAVARARELMANWRTRDAFVRVALSCTPEQVAGLDALLGGANPGAKIALLAAASDTACSGLLDIGVALANNEQGRRAFSALLGVPDAESAVGDVDAARQERIRGLLAMRQSADLAATVVAVAALVETPGPAVARAMIRALGRPPLVDDAQATQRYWELWAEPATRQAMVRVVPLSVGDSMANSVAAVLHRQNAAEIMRQLAELPARAAANVLWLVGSDDFVHDPVVRERFWGLWAKGPVPTEAFGFAVGAESARGLAMMLRRPGFDDTFRQLAAIRDWADRTNVLWIAASPQLVGNEEATRRFGALLADESTRKALASACKAAAGGGLLAERAARGLVDVLGRPDCVDRLRRLADTDTPVATGALSTRSSLEANSDTSAARKPRDLALRVSPHDSVGLARVLQVRARHLVADASGSPPSDATQDDGVDYTPEWLWLSHVVTSWSTLTHAAPHIDRAFDLLEGVTRPRLQERLLEAVARCQPREAARLLGNVAEVKNPVDRAYVLHAVALAEEVRDTHARLPETMPDFQPAPLGHPGGGRRSPTMLQALTARMLLGGAMVTGDALITSLCQPGPVDPHQVRALAAAVHDVAARYRPGENVQFDGALAAVDLLSTLESRPQPATHSAAYQPSQSPRPRNQVLRSGPGDVTVTPGAPTIG